MKLSAVLLHGALSSSLTWSALAGEATALPEGSAMHVTVQVDFGADLGQNFGTLFEITDRQGRVVAGAGFQGLYNTTCRNDRRALQCFVSPAEDSVPPVHDTLPRFSADTGVYIGDVDGRLLVRPLNATSRPQLWDAAAGAWEPSADHAAAGLIGGDGAMHLGDGVLSFERGCVAYRGETILAAPERETIHHVYYAQGHLFFYHSRSGVDDADSFTRVCALPWRPGQAAPDLSKAVTQPTTTLRQTTWAWGQLGETVLTVTNWGGVYAFRDGAWRTLRTVDGKSFQVYAMLNYYDRLLLGQYPTGCLYEFDGEAMRLRELWPPSLPGVATYSREAQALALYRGDLYATVWPWAEVWRYDRQKDSWMPMERLFSQPPLTAAVGHPYEAEIVAYNQANGTKHVMNDWGQRATSLVSLGDALYVGTANKGGTPRPEGYTFITDAALAEYGLVHRFRWPGQITGQVRWTGAPTTFECVVADGRLRLLQDGRELAATAIETGQAAGLAGATVTWGQGMYGPLAGTILSHRPE